MKSLKFSQFSKHAPIHDKLINELLIEVFYKEDKAMVRDFKDNSIYPLSLGIGIIKV